MKIYSEDAIKEFHPRYTVEKCSRIAKRFRFKEMTDRFIEIFYERKTEFGAFSGNFSINPLVLYELFPDKFYYLRDVNDYPEESSNGKGLSFLQCQASVYMEMFERLSIKLKEYELQYGKKFVSRFPPVVIHRISNIKVLRSTKLVNSWITLAKAVSGVIRMNRLTSVIDSALLTFILRICM